jgi:hypothetical protein
MQTIDSPVATPERPQLFERESVMVNEPDFRPSIGSVFDEERQQLDATNKRMITYFTVFALSEYLFLLIFQLYFYLHKSRLYHPDLSDPLPLLDFEVSKFYFYRSLSVLAILLNRKTGADHILLILREFRGNQSFLIFVILKILLAICTILLVQYHPVATILLLLHTKIVYVFATKVLRRYQLRNIDFALLAAFGFLVLTVYFFGSQFLPFSIFTIFTGGILFFASEELVTTHINLQEWEVLRYLSLLFVALLFFAKEILATDETILGFEMSDMIVAVGVVLIDLSRVFVIKRIHTYVRENTARIYFPLMIVFVGVLAVLLDLVLVNPFLTGGEFVGQLIFLATLIYFHRSDLRRLFMIQTADDLPRPSQEILVSK